MIMLTLNHSPMMMKMPPDHGIDTVLELITSCHDYNDSDDSDTFNVFELPGYREAPKSLSGRVLAVSWWFFVAMLLIGYTSNLTALVTSRPHLKPALSFRNYEDILRDRRIDVGMV